MAARCLSQTDAGLDDVSDAPEETSEGSLRQLLSGAAGYETQLTSITLAPFKRSQVSLPTEQELVVCADLVAVAPLWCLKHLVTRADACPHVPVEPASSGTRGHPFR